MTLQEITSAVNDRGYLNRADVSLATQTLSGQEDVRQSLIDFINGTTVPTSDKQKVLEDLESYL